MPARPVPCGRNEEVSVKPYSESPDLDVGRAVGSLVRHWDGLFKFLSVVGVEPTNNPAETAVRPAVRCRKISFGNRSPEGETLTPGLLTVIRTYVLKGKNAFEFLLPSIGAYRQGLQATSLT